MKYKEDIFVFGKVSTQNDYPTIRVPGNVTEPPEIWEMKKSFPVSLAECPLTNLSLV